MKMRKFSRTLKIAGKFEIRSKFSRNQIFLFSEGMYVDRFPFLRQTSFVSLWKKFSMFNEKLNYSFVWYFYQLFRTLKDKDCNKHVFAVRNVYQTCKRRSWND